MTRVFSEKISTRATRRPELESAVQFAGEIRSSGVAVTLVVHEHKRLVITTGAKKGQHPSPATVMRMLREYDDQTAAAVNG
ncbi:hypothetical protein ACFXMT_19935 [Streptomyces mirabilis]|uniref:hypothetical protein n=1 Tax=Streptomyces mirabilis TaxID=68239 RepID=UPI003681B9B4